MSKYVQIITPRVQRRENFEKWVADFVEEDLANKLNIKYFYINLEGAWHRKDLLVKQFENFNMCVERFNAVNGKLKYPGHRWAGSLACKDSHLQLWRTIQKGEIFVIFEDDIIIHSDSFEDILKDIPDKDWHMCNFGIPVTKYRPEIIGDQISENWKKASNTTLKGRNSGLWAYAINGDKIKDLLDLYENPQSKGSCIDVYLRSKMSTINCYFYTGPTVVTHSGRNSNRMTIDKEETKKGRKKLRHKKRRIRRR